MFRCCPTRRKLKPLRVGRYAVFYSCQMVPHRCNGVDLNRFANASSANRWLLGKNLRIIEG